MFRGQGDATFGAPMVTGTDFGPGLAVGDLDEDGWPDAAIAMPANRVY